MRNNGQAILTGQTIQGQGQFGISGVVSGQTSGLTITGTQTSQNTSTTTTSSTGTSGNVSTTGNQGNINIPTGTTTTGNTSVSGSINNSERLSGLISNYSSTTTTVTTNYGNSGRYPELELPTSPSPNLTNLTPNLISTQQTTPTSANRNPITPDDVTLRAAS